MNFTKEEFEETKLKAEEEYHQIGEVRCPFLEEKIVFNAEGLEHIKFKSWNFARNEQDQFTRLRLLHLAPQILKKSHTLQGINSGNKIERVKVKNKWESRMMYITYYEFIAVIDNCRIKILVKKVNNGQPYFWSIIPSWKQTEYGRKLFDGNSEED